jgi:hypothetical protein
VEGEQVAAREHVRPVVGHRGKLDRLEEIRQLLPVASIPLHLGRYLLIVACSRVVRPAAAGGREPHDKDGADESSETGLTDGLVGKHHSHLLVMNRLSFSPMR